MNMGQKIQHGVTLIMLFFSISILLVSCEKDPALGSYTIYGDGTATLGIVIYDAVTDYDGNTYNAVQIGDQYWMKENLKTTHYADGTAIALGNASSSLAGDGGYRFMPNNDSSTVSSYGYLYNWKAVMHGAASSESAPSGVQGICPNGWHVPSREEWLQLIDYVTDREEYHCNNSSTSIGKSLAATTDWHSSEWICAVGYQLSSNNATAFSALPAGVFFSCSLNFSESADFWSCTESGTGRAYYGLLQYNTSDMTCPYSSETYAYSVRCLRN